MVWCLHILWRSAEYWGFSSVNCHRLFGSLSSVSRFLPHSSFLTTFVNFCIYFVEIERPQQRHPVTCYQTEQAIVQVWAEQARALCNSRELIKRRPIVRSRSEKVSFLRSPIGSRWKSFHGRRDVKFSCTSLSVWSPSLSHSASTFTSLYTMQP